MAVGEQIGKVYPAVGPFWAVVSSLLGKCRQLYSSVSNFLKFETVLGDFRQFYNIVSIFKQCLRNI